MTLIESTATQEPSIENFHNAWFCLDQQIHIQKKLNATYTYKY